MDETSIVMSIYNNFVRIKEPDQITLLYDYLNPKNNFKLSQFPATVSASINDDTFIIMSKKLKLLKEVKEQIIKSGLMCFDSEIIFDTDVNEFVYIADYLGEEQPICYN